MKQMETELVGNQKMIVIHRFKGNRKEAPCDLCNDVRS